MFFLTGKTVSPVEASFPAVGVRQAGQTWWKGNYEVVPRIQIRQ
jgi:hypothetical protein